MKKKIQVELEKVGEMCGYNIYKPKAVDVEEIADKINHSIDEAEKIHRGEKDGMSFDEFLKDF